MSSSVAPTLARRPRSSSTPHFISAPISLPDQIQLGVRAASGRPLLRSDGKIVVNAYGPAKTSSLNLRLALAAPVGSSGSPFTRPLASSGTMARPVTATTAPARHVAADLRGRRDWYGLAEEFLARRHAEVRIGVDLELHVLLDLDDVGDRRPDLGEQLVERLEEVPPLRLGLRGRRRSVRLGGDGSACDFAGVVDRGAAEERIASAGGDARTVHVAGIDDPGDGPLRMPHAQ